MISPLPHWWWKSNCPFIFPKYCAHKNFILMQLSLELIAMYWRGPNYRKEFAVYRLFCNQNQEKTQKKNTRRFKVNSSSIRQYTFCLEIQSINWGNSAFFDPSFCCTFRSHRTLIIGSRVSMSVKHKPLHWYCTLLSENPSLRSAWRQSADLSVFVLSFIFFFFFFHLILLLYRRLRYTISLPFIIQSYSKLARW